MNELFHPGFIYISFLFLCQELFYLFFSFVKRIKFLFFLLTPFYIYANMNHKDCRNKQNNKGEKTWLSKLKTKTTQGLFIIIPSVQSGQKGD